MIKFFALLALVSSVSLAAPGPGDKAPDFELKAASGKKVKLGHYRGKPVVLEWLNHGCPFVKKHYDSMNMPNLQKEFTEKGVVWLSIISSAKGKQGYSTPDKALQDKANKKSKATHILLDDQGEVGRKYGAKVTPHMFVIDKKGTIVYAGAIDSIPSTDVKDLDKASPYVKNALNSLMNKSEVKIKQSKPYGCSVKY